MSRLQIFFITILLTISSAFAGEFVSGKASAIAGTISKSDRFYMYTITADADPRTVLPALHDIFEKAAKEKYEVAVIGPDYRMNDALLTIVFAVAQKDSLKGATILYVNDGRDISDLANRAAPTGAVIRSAKYNAK